MQRRTALALLALGLAAPALAAPPMIFVHSAPTSNTDTRQDYAWRLLRAALERTRREFGDFVMSGAPSMNEARQISETIAGHGTINTLVLPARHEFTESLIPVRIPVDRGLLGYRVMLIRAADQARFDAVRTLDDLKGLRIGVGANWVDLKILEDAGLNVVGGGSYEGLFNMLLAGRFDAFNRGASEAVHEFDARHAAMPELAIEKSLLLYYPMPGYFWFPNTREGAARARRVERGLSAMVADGSLNRMFLGQYGPAIQRLGLRQRRLLVIRNSQLGPEEPLDNAALWYSPWEGEARPAARPR